MNIEDVRAFVTVVDTGSVGRAALRLNLTQPGVSRRVQRLEEALGITLLDRDSKPARPTRAGEAAYRKCMAVLRASEALAREANAPVSAGPLRIAASLGIAESVFAPALEALREAHPHATLHLSTGRSPELRKQVAESLVDAAIVMVRPDRPVDEPHAELLGSERVVVVAGTRLAAPSRCRLADLAQQSWVINPDGCGFRTQLDRALAVAGHSLEIAAESWGTSLQLALVARGAGLGLVAQRMVRESPHAAALRAIAVEDFRPVLNVWLVRAAELGPLGAAVDVLAETVRGVLAADAVPANEPSPSIR
jgi:DNA-binding transcriptional LysR family regulator